MKALLIQVDFATGKRAGNIDPRDIGLGCDPSHQNIDRGIEIRTIEDNRDLKQYRGVKGVTVLEDNIAINNAIQKNIPARYEIQDKELLLAHMKEKNISLDSVVGKRLSDITEELYKKGLAGIIKKEPKLI